MTDQKRIEELEKGLHGLIKALDKLASGVVNNAGAIGSMIDISRDHKNRIEVLEEDSKDNVKIKLN